ncbi:MAG: hypothetical protein K9W44_02210 [Candidatus Lokiarchaeota archaeon]|nr:hypothetical protein [Candidatus Harpocratesius repetitus]
MSPDYNQDLKSFSEIQLPQSYHNMPRCEWCNKPLPKRYISHINLQQDPPEHKFCSRSCKEKWCANAGKTKAKPKSKKKK